MELCDVILMVKKFGKWTLFVEHSLINLVIVSLPVLMMRRGLGLGKSVMRLGRGFAAMICFAVRMVDGVK
jgi:hypothetical protein